MTRPRSRAATLLACAAGLSLAAVLPPPAFAQAGPPPPAAAPSASTTFSSASGAAPASIVPAVFTLERLIEIARTQGPAFAAVRARIVGAEAGLLTAGTRPNPEFDLQAGRQSASGGSVPGATGGFGVLQPIDRASLREARLGVATTFIEGARAEASVFERDRVADLTLRYLDVLRLQSAARLAEEDLSIAEQIRSRVQVRVGTGEAPRFELIRADAERLNAQRAVQASAARIDVARAELRRLVGATLPADFAVVGSIEDAVPMPPTLESLRTSLRARHPELAAARAAVRNAEARLALERERARPTFAVRAGVERVPEVTDARIGLVVQVPIFDRRQGPIAEATADAERSRLELADRELQLGQALEVAWQRYRIALGQVAAYESGLLREAQAALRVAEAAYRFGERGILDYLDAQRTFRTIRNELNATRYDLRAALVELERLRAESE
ncbi:MAG: TolC family protein [Burkholderiales bacterium]|nr:TolC family protein [Burkholderiales bacterium]